MSKSCLTLTLEPPVYQWGEWTNCTQTNGTCVRTRSTTYRQRNSVAGSDGTVENAGICRPQVYQRECCADNCAGKFILFTYHLHIVITDSKI